MPPVSVTVMSMPAQPVSLFLWLFLVAVRDGRTTLVAG
jgi:hypothetical protein